MGRGKRALSPKTVPGSHQSSELVGSSINQKQNGLTEERAALKFNSGESWAGVGRRLSPGPPGYQPGSKPSGPDVGAAVKSHVNKGTANRKVVGLALPGCAARRVGQSESLKDELSRVTSDSTNGNARRPGNGEETAGRAEVLLSRAAITDKAGLSPDSRVHARKFTRAQERKAGLARNTNGKQEWVGPHLRSRRRGLPNWANENTRR